MADTGWLACGTAADDSGVGTVAWTTPSNATADDATETSSDVWSGTPISHYLKCTNFGAAVPSGATIDGIEMRYQRRDGSASAVLNTHRIRIVKGGTIGATDRADVVEWLNSTSSATTETITVGGATDLWGESWTDTDINATTFGAAIAAAWVSGSGNEAWIDFVEIKVYYTVAGGTAGRLVNGCLVNGLLMGSLA